MSSNLRELWSAAGGNTPEHWEFKTIEELLAHPKAISVGVMYPGTNAENGIPLVRVSDVKNGAIVSKPEFGISLDIDEEYKRTRLDGSELLITLVGNPGDCVVASIEMAGWNVARALAVVRLRDIELRSWLRYTLLSGPAKHLIGSRLNTTVQKTLNLKDIRELGIPIPPDKERQKIVDIIDAIESKANINTQTNQTLESIAQAIFKSWFVDFEPVKAKMAAKERWYAVQPTSESASPVCYADESALPDLETYTNLAAMCAISGKSETELAQLQQQNPDHYQQLAETAALFPSAMVDSELGEIPEGWEVQSYADLCKKIESGGTPKRNEDSYWNGDVRWLSSGEVRDRIVIDTKERITVDGLSNSSAKLWPKYTTVIAMYGATAGEACLLAEEMCANQACCGLIPKEEYVSFIYLSAIRSSQILSEKASGSAQQNLNKGIIEHHQLIAPPPELANFFELSTRKMILKLIENYKQSAALSQLRDALLPKLLSGEIDLTKVENEVT